MTFKHDVDHMPGQVYRKLSDLRGHKESKFTVETNPIGTHKKYSVTVSATSKNHANNLAAAHFTKQGLKNGEHFDGFKVMAEEVESIDETHKINDTVIMSYPSLKGVKGRIGEIRHGAYKGAPKTYTIDYQHPKHSAQHTSSIQLSSSQFKAHKEGTLGEEIIDEVSKKTLKSYIKRAAKDKEDTLEKGYGILHTDRSDKEDKLEKLSDRLDKREDGINSAKRKLKEETLDEMGYGQERHAEFSFADSGSAQKEVTKKFNVKTKGGNLISTHTNALDAVRARAKIGDHTTHSIVKEMVEIDEISAAQMSRQGKTTIKHIKDPGVELRMAAHDIKPGIAGYRDRIDLLNAAKAQGKLKEEVEEIDEASFTATMKKAIDAHSRGDKKLAKYHLDNAKTARYSIPSTEISKHKDMLDKYTKLRELYEEVESVDELWANRTTNEPTPGQHRTNMKRSTTRDNNLLAKARERMKAEREAEKSKKIKEEVEEIDELSIDTVKSYKAKVATNPAPSKTTSDILHKAIRRFAGKERAEDRIHHDEMVKMRGRLGIKEETVTEGEFADSLKSRAKALVKKLSAPVKDPILDQMKDISATANKRADDQLKKVDASRRTKPNSLWLATHPDNLKLGEETLDEGKGTGIGDLVKFHKIGGMNGHRYAEITGFVLSKKDGGITPQGLVHGTATHYKAKLKKDPMSRVNTNPEIHIPVGDVKKVDQSEEIQNHLMRMKGIKEEVLDEGKFIETHKGEDAHGEPKPNPKHPAYATHKKAYDAKVAERKATTFSLKNHTRSKAPEENPVKMHHIDSAISNSFPDVDAYEHLKRQFPHLHKQDGRSGSKLTDWANKTVAAHTKNKHKTLSSYTDAVYKDMHDDKMMGEGETVSEGEFADSLKSRARALVKKFSSNNKPDTSFISDKEYNEVSTHVNNVHPGFKLHSLGRTTDGSISWAASHKDDKGFKHSKSGVFKKQVKEEVLDEAKTHEVRLEFGSQQGDSATYKVNAKDSADAKKKAISLHRKSWPYHKEDMLASNAYVSKLDEEVLDEVIKTEKPKHKVGDTVYATSPTNKALTMTGKVTKIGATLTTVKHRDGSEAHYPHKLVDNDYEVLHPNPYKKLQREHLEQTGELLTLSEVKYMVENANGGVGAIAQHAGVNGEPPQGTGKIKKMMGNKTSVDAIVKIIAKGAKPN